MQKEFNRVRRLAIWMTIISLLALASTYVPRNDHKVIVVRNFAGAVIGGSELPRDRDIDGLQRIFFVAFVAMSGFQVAVLDLLGRSLGLVGSVPPSTKQ